MKTIKDLRVTRLLWFALGIIAAILFSSCTAQRFATTYKITSKDKNYYVNSYTVVNDSVFCKETKRNGKIREVPALQFSSSQITETKKL